MFRPQVVGQEGDRWEVCGAVAARHDAVGVWGYRPSDESAECFGCGERVPVTVLTERGREFLAGMPDDRDDARVGRVHESRGHNGLRHPSTRSTR